MRNRVQLVLLIAVLLLVHPASGHLPGPLDTFSPTASGANAVQLRAIMFPVAGPASYSDTFGACRDGCSRSHQGVDIFAPKLTPLIAAADGRIVSERRNATRKAGNKLVIEDAAGWRYIYLHLNNDTPGTDDDANPQSWIAAGDLRAGDTVRAGQVIGYLGDSGNAEETPPHLHFEIMPPAQGSINPTPAITAARGRGDVVAASELWLADEVRADWEPIVDDAYQDLAGRPPTDDERSQWTNRLALGLGTETDLIADLAMAAPFREPEGMALRAYVVTFGHVPSEEVLTSLATGYRDGGSTDDLAGHIVDSTNYRSLGPADPSRSLERSDIVDMAESVDVKHDTWHLLQIVRAYRAAAGRLPTAEEIDAWTGYLQRGGLVVDVVAGALEEAMPTGEPRNASVFTPTDLGYQPGESVRQGPIDLDPATDPGDGGIGMRTFDRPDFDVDLAIDEGDDGSDVANLTVRIPVDELVANSDGEAELTIELQLSPGDGPDGDAEATADVELVTVSPDDGEERAGQRTIDRSADDGERGPAVTTPTTRPPVPRRPSAPNRPAPTTTQPAPPSPAPPNPAPPNPAPPSPAPAPQPSPDPSPTSTVEPATSPPTSSSPSSPTTEVAAPPSSSTTAPGTPIDGEQPTTTCVPATVGEPDDPDRPAVDSSGGPDPAADAGCDPVSGTGDPPADESVAPEPTDGTGGTSEEPGADAEQSSTTDSTDSTNSTNSTDSTETTDNTEPAEPAPAGGDGESATSSCDEADQADGASDGADSPTGTVPCGSDTTSTDDQATADDQASAEEASAEDGGASATGLESTSSSPEPAAVTRLPAVQRSRGSRRRWVVATPGR